MTVTQYGRRGLGAVRCTGPTCPQLPISLLQPTTKPYTGPPGVQVSGTAGPVRYLGWMPATQGGPCAYTSSTGQVMPGMWDSTLGCMPILYSNPLQAINVPSGGATVLLPGTSVQAAQTTTTSYVPWIIGAAAVVLAVVLMMTR